MNEYDFGEFDNTHYLSRSWKMLTAEKGWYKPVLVLAAVFCIPVAGSILGTLAMLGYALEWARLTAWGIDSVPKQRNIKAGAILASGWRGFAVSIVWGLMYMLVLALLGLLLAAVGLVFLTAIIQLVGSLVLGIVVTVAVMRAAVYQRFGAGFGFKQIWEMIRRDTNGLLHVWGVSMLCGFVVGLVGFVISMAIFTSMLPTVFTNIAPLINEYEYYGYLTEYETTQMVAGIMNAFTSVWPAMVVLKFVCGGFSAVTTMITYTACGLWFRQFDVPSWGSPSDPLPSVSAPDGPSPEL